MQMLLIQFIVIAVIAGIGLWALAQFPAADAVIVKLIRIGVIVVISVLLLNLIIFALFGKMLSGLLYG